MQTQAQQALGDRCFTGRRQDHSQTTLDSGQLTGDISRAARKRAGGFTIIELVVSMAIAAVLIGVGLPAFNGFIVQQRLTADANSFAGAIAYARSESTRRGSTVSLQAMGNDGDNEWGNGFCIVVGTPGDCDAPLRIYDPATLATVNGQGNLDGISTLSFNGRGLFTLGINGQLDLCSNDTLEDPGRQLDISVIGRLNIGSLDCPD